MFLIFHPKWAARGFAAASLLFFSAACAKAQEAYEIPQPEAPAAPVVVPPAPFEKTVWRAGRNGVLKLSGPLAGYAGPLQVRDFGGKVVWNGVAKAGASSVALRVSRAGLYTLQAGDKTFSFSVVPRPKARRAQVSGRMRIGLNTHFGPRDAPEEAFKILREAGIDSVRDEMGWGSMEKVKGVFDFIPRHVRYNAKLKEYGIPLHWSASYGSPLYPQVARYPSAEAAEPYARYVVEVLKKFGDNIIAVEVLNEPNKVGPVKDYAPVLRATTRAVKAAGFKQPVIATGGAGTGGGMVPDYARTVFGSGALSEGFSIHPYMAPFPPDTGYSPPGGAANLDAALTRAGNVVRDFNLQGTWITELGWSGMENGLIPTIENWVTPNSARTMNPEPKQAAFTARTLLVASKYPHLKAIYLYDFQDDGPIPSRREHRFGLVRQDLQPKMGFQAFAVAKDFLSDKVFVKRFHQPNSILSANLYRDRAGQHWLAAWTMEVTPGQVDEVVARKKKGESADLPRRHMDNEFHARFRIPGMQKLSGMDWQGAPLPSAPEMTATSLPMYLRVGRNPNAVSINIVGVQQVKNGMEGFPEEEVTAAIAARNAEVAAKAQAAKAQTAQ